MPQRSRVHGPPGTAVTVLFSGDDVLIAEENIETGRRREADKNGVVGCIGIDPGFMDGKSLGAEWGKKE